MIIPVGLLTVQHLPIVPVRYVPNEIVIFSWLLFIQLIGIIYNNCINIFLVNRFFPDNILTLKIRRLLIASQLLDILLILTLTGVAIAGIEEMFLEEGKISKYGAIALSEIAVLITVTVYFIILRTQVNKFLKRNNAIKHLINEIGE